MKKANTDVLEQVMPQERPFSLDSSCGTIMSEFQKNLSYKLNFK